MKAKRVSVDTMNNKSATYDDTLSNAKQTYAAYLGQATDSNLIDTVLDNGMVQRPWRDALDGITSAAAPTTAIEFAELILSGEYWIVTRTPSVRHDGLATPLEIMRDNYLDQLENDLSPLLDAELKRRGIETSENQR